MKRNTIITTIATALLVGCVTYQAPTHTITTPFNEADFAAYVAPGTATVTGQAFAKTMGGEVRYGAGETVKLIPKTPYTTEAYNACKADKSLANKNPGMDKFTRTTTSDGGGNFEFKNVPAGDYYIQCPVVWHYVSSGVQMQTGGYAYAETSVKAGETVRVMVTR